MDARWKLYRQPVFTGGAEPQEDGMIARAWIVDPKVYPGITRPDNGVPARGDTDGRFVKMVGFLFAG